MEYVAKYGTGHPIRAQRGPTGLFRALSKVLGHLSSFGPSPTLRWGVLGTPFLRLGLLSTFAPLLFDSATWGPVSRCCLVASRPTLQ